MRSFILMFLTLGGVSMAEAECLPLYQHQFKTLQGQTVDFCQFQDKPVLIVNTASKCGFTPQFEALEAMYEQYKDKGLVVIGFPSNDFRQEPGNNKQIGDFCKLTYSVKFPMVEKSSVTGSGANPLYQQLIKQTGQAPQWNFYKYLILPGGQKVYSFNSMTRPESEEILGKIKPHLK
ncbi:MULTISPECIES: glutathione peroxidase [unclassified Methylophilus]|jgi:glutathione peroxidase|uniref:Glutathione peroxidase n=1 Tax=Methylophilus glucosoxydans TaxID=752553 RepID=A0ABW3GNF1_9PROT|nr:MULTISPECIES: glutathione peroxidase [unclassified Methylophilus]BEV08166.1 glutathione peroxidase [Methylophilus sp. DW102]